MQRWFIHERLCGSVPRTLLFCLFLLFSRVALAAPTLELDGDSQAGHVTVSWAAREGADASEFQVQEATSNAFQDARDIYRGQHTASVISGLRNGDFYFRARAKTGAGWSDWSEPAKFHVEHPSLRIAFGLFGLGALVFGATTWVIVRGARSSTAERGTP
jgi:hypothetical protein